MLSDRYKNLRKIFDENFPNMPKKIITFKYFKEESEERGVKPEYLEKSLHTYMYNFKSFSLDEVIRLAEIYQLEILEKKDIA